MGTDVDGSEGSLTLPQPTCLSAHPLASEEDVAHPTLNDRQDPGLTQPMSVHSSTKWFCFDVIEIDVVGRVPIDVANDAGAEFARLLASQLLCGASPVRSNVDDRTFEEQPGPGYA